MVFISGSDPLNVTIRIVQTLKHEYFKKTYLAKKALKRFKLRNNVEMYNNIFYPHNLFTYCKIKTKTNDIN